MKVATGVKNIIEGIKDSKGREGHLTEEEDTKVDNGTCDSKVLFLWVSRTYNGLMSTQNHKSS